MKLISAALLLIALAYAGNPIGLTPTLASPGGAPAVGPTTVQVGDSTGVTASWMDEDGNAVFSATNDIGDFISASATGGNDLGPISGIGSAVLTIQGDVDNLIESSTVTAVFKCITPGTTQFTLADDNGVSPASVTLTCVEAPGGGSDEDPLTGLLGVYQIVVTANPNILPCDGGTTVVTAEAIDAFGNELPGAEFRFYTDAGTLVQTSRNTAKLTLGPNQTFAEVIASIPDAEAEEVDEATTFVGLECNDFSTVVVTASPNVIDCTGTSTITASARDVNGHVVTGVGFHFTTTAGLLEVSPNNANNEEGVATLTLRPGDGDATIVVSVGPEFGTYEEIDDVESNFTDEETGMVTVQQRCLSTTTGQIQVNSSSLNVTCGENVFIGLHVIDEDIQTVVDDTPISLIATAGGFYGGVVDGGQTLLPAAQVPTSHGEANTIYTAPANFSGEVKITAASGDVYGSTKLNVSCVTSASTGTGSATGASTPACQNIGDGICITPPNTGRNQITPPSTGSAGLK